MALALFDLDETLLSADSDYLWGKSLLAAGLVDETSFRETLDRLSADYRAGSLDIDAYISFACGNLARHDRGVLDIHRAQFVESVIQPLILPEGQKLIRAHRSRNDTVLVITATIDYVAAPIVDLFDVHDLIAPVVEIRGNQFTGAALGTPSFREGKVIRLQQWLREHGGSLEGSTFYSDSINDLPLLEAVTFPVAVDPDVALKRVATDRNWPIISLRDA